MSKAIIHFLDSARGQFIPRDFAQCINREFLSGVSNALMDSLAKEDSNDGEFYWDDWDQVLNKARIIVDGIEYTLHHDGDLWLINFDLMTNEEKQNFGFEDF